MKNIRNKLGDKFILGGDSLICRVDAISAIAGTLPVWHFDMNLELRYYINELST
jgi:hypothetical protein